MVVTCLSSVAPADKLKQQIRSLFSEEKQQYNQIQAHEKDKETLRKEMREREETIAEVRGCG